MRVLIHDYAGHPTAVQLSRRLAARDHEVFHAWCEHLVSPRGHLARREGDPANLRFLPVHPPLPIEKGKLVRRWFQETAYGQRLVEAFDRVRPEVVLSANTPLDAQARLLPRSRERGARFVFWVQDLLGIGSRNVLSRRFGRVGHVIGSRFVRMEARLLRESDAAVLITEDFRPPVREFGVDAARIHVIENWAPLDEVPQRDRDNAWARRHGLVDKTVLLYSGTLGMKHDPALLLELARRMRPRAGVRVVVVSEGTGAEWLARERERAGVDNLLHFGFQPFADVPDVLGSADVLLAVLERGAGVFSVPSKVLTGLCAGRPLLLSVPPENLAARIVASQCAGLVVEPGDVAAFTGAAERLIDEPELRAQLGANARRHAERTFDAETIASRFERILEGDGAAG